MPTVKRKDRPPAAPRDARETGPQFAWGSSAFGPQDEVDGTRVNGYRLVRTPEGGLVGIVEPTESRETE